jgi:GTPase SAR1 family protein
MGKSLCTPRKELPEPRFVRLLFVGESGVGKTSLITEICYGTFAKSVP